nr:unnamed protein product [Spirometra erinaceieuropaei]
MVSKATSGNWRPCGDYRVLNNAKIPGRYFVPHLQDFARIPVVPENITKAAITPPSGLFELIRMSFGLRNVAQMFQRFINHVLRGLTFVHACTDVVLVASPNAEEHKEHLALVFDRLDKFGVITNPSRLLTFASRSHSDKYNPREIAHVDCISQFTIDMCHIDSLRSEVADMLSRPSLFYLQLSHGIDLSAMTAEQRVGFHDDESVSGAQLKNVPLTTGTSTIFHAISTLFYHHFVSVPMRPVVFQALHGLSHPGIRASQKLLAERFVWTDMNNDAEAWVRSCLRCRQNKARRHSNSPPGTFSIADARFSRVHLDVATSSPPSNGHTHLPAPGDRYTRSAKTIPLSSVQAFVSRWTTGLNAASTFTTDQGANFESTLFQAPLNFLGCTRIRTTAYHPAANGVVERLHHQLKTVLRALEDPAS